MYLGPGQALIPGFVHNLSSFFGLVLPQLSVVSQDLRVGLQHVVEDVEAVGAAHLRTPFHGTGLGVAQVPVGAHQSQQVRAHCSDLLRRRGARVGGLVHVFQAVLQELVKNGELCVFLGADGAEPLQRAGRQEIAQLWPLKFIEKRKERKGK